MYLIDTNVLILAIAGKEPSASFLKRIISEKRGVLSVITIAEFLSKATTKEIKLFEKLLSIFDILDIDEDVARIAAGYRRVFLKISRVKLLDYLIAAQAKKNKLILVTNNVSDFPMKDIKIITPGL